MPQVRRDATNPNLQPNTDQYWQAQAAFNGCPVDVDGVEYMTYRAISDPHYYFKADKKMELSTVGIGRLEDGQYVDRKQLITPEHPWEKYGCEDPRTIHFEGRYYTFYTALSQFPFNAEGIKVALGIGDEVTKIDEKHQVTPFNAKAMSLFPERIGGKIYTILSANTDIPPARICIAEFDEIEQVWDQDRWSKWYENMEDHSLNLLRSDRDQVEVGAPPIKTEHGWLIIYAYIRNYYSNQPVLGVEAALLDLQDPTKVVARTSYPLLVPKEWYEKYGMVPNVIFPTGAKIDGDELVIYYGGADTVNCTARIDLDDLYRIMCVDDCVDHRLHRYKKNPILKPIKQNAWEALATFNPSVVDLGDEAVIVYRAMSIDNTSYMGYASTRDGYTIEERLAEPIYGPREDFEGKGIPNGNSGCEDPRCTVLEDRVYMCYTAYNGLQPPRIAITSLGLDEFKAKNWQAWTKPVLISPPDFDNKDACVMPTKVDGKYMMIHRVGNDMDYDLLDTLDFDGKTYLSENRWIKVRPGMWDDLKIGLSGTPVLIDEGWLMFYHGVSSVDHGYRAGVILLDRDDPRKVLGRSYHPLIEPQEDYELFGIVNRVVFPEGAIVRGREVIVYYGGADQVVAAASMQIDALLASLV